MEREPKLLFVSSVGARVAGGGATINLLLAWETWSLLMFMFMVAVGVRIVVVLIIEAVSDMGNWLLLEFKIEDCGLRELEADQEMLALGAAGGLKSGHGGAPPFMSCWSCMPREPRQGSAFPQELVLSRSESQSGIGVARCKSS